MKFVPYNNGDCQTFRVLKHRQEEVPPPPSIALKSVCTQKVCSEWILIDENPSLLALLSKYEMLEPTKSEKQWSDREIRRMDYATLKYCKQQAMAIGRYADDAMYRIATKTLCEEAFAHYDEQGLPAEVRRLVLAIALQMGVKLK